MSLPDFGIDEVYQRSDQRHWTLKCLKCGAWTALDKAFPTKLGEEVRIILPRPDDSGFYRACPKCSAELDLAAGEWVADFPDRDIHGYRISQLFSSKVDPGEILAEYRLTRYPDRFYNLKIGVPWSGTDRRLDEATVLSLCTDDVMIERGGPNADYIMGVDTGKALHVVVLETNRNEGEELPRLVALFTCREFAELDAIMERFAIKRCVIDGLPETHATRAFAERALGHVSMCFFNEHQRGEAKWDYRMNSVIVNRTEVLDASRLAIRERQVALPRRNRALEQFAKHMAADAKVLDEDEDTGAQRYRYIGLARITGRWRSPTRGWRTSRTLVGRCSQLNDGRGTWRTGARGRQKRSGADASALVSADVQALGPGCDIVLP